MANNLLQLSLKVWNWAMGLGGLATILYGILIFRVSQVAGGETSSAHHIIIPWFFHAFLFVGIVLCAVTCLGYLAAHTANTCCLSTYIVIILLLLILEIVIITDAFLNPKWEKELPVNITGRFDDFMDSVVPSHYILKCLASIVFLIQAICVLLAAFSIHEHKIDVYESEYEDDHPFDRWQQDGRHIV